MFLQVQTTASDKQKRQRLRAMVLQSLPLILYVYTVVSDAIPTRATILQ